MVVMLSTTIASMNAQFTRHSSASSAHWTKTALCELPLLVAKGFDGIEIGCLPCGIDAENQANHAGDSKADHCPHAGHGCRERTQQQTYQQCDDAAGDNADDTSEGAERDCLDRELQQNITLRRADGFAHADLLCALGN